jgi:hypothetical protein
VCREYVKVWVQPPKENNNKKKGQMLRGDYPRRITEKEAPDSPSIHEQPE